MEIFVWTYAIVSVVCPWVVLFGLDPANGKRRNMLVRALMLTGANLSVCVLLLLALGNW